MTPKERLHPFFDKIPEQYRAQSVIVGGAVVDLDKASDVDIFILDVTNTQAGWDLCNQACLSHNPGSIKATEEDGASISRDGIVFESDGRKFNIIPTAFETVLLLLLDFDLSICRHAYDSYGFFYTGIGASLPGQPITVCHWPLSRRESTLARIAKYLERFPEAREETAF